MFSIEHEFDHTAVTLMDEGDAPLKEDVIVRAYDDRIEVEQWDQAAGRMQRISLSLEQAADLAAALTSGEGLYSRNG